MSKAEAEDATSGLTRPNVVSLPGLGRPIDAYVKLYDGPE